MRRRSSQRRKNQPPKNEWKEDEEPKEVVKDEPTPPSQAHKPSRYEKEGGITIRDTITRCATIWVSIVETG